MKIQHEQLRKMIKEVVSSDFDLIVRRIDYLPFQEITTPEMVDFASNFKQLGNRTIDKLVDHFGISYGHAVRLAAAIKEYRRDNYGPTRSMSDTRVDRLSRTRDSSGRATPRRMR